MMRSKVFPRRWVVKSINCCSTALSRPSRKTLASVSAKSLAISSSYEKNSVINIAVVNLLRDEY